jgi:hypothetical protein
LLYLWNFSEFKNLLCSYPPSKLAKHQEDYALKSSMLGKIVAERLIEQEKVNTQLSQESKKLKRKKHLPFVVVREYLYIHLVVVFCLNKLFL